MSPVQTFQDALSSAGADYPAPTVRLTAVGLNGLHLSDWFLETARVKTRLTPCARLMAESAAA
jgi:hypothetical protein